MSSSRAPGKTPRVAPLTPPAAEGATPPLPKAPRRATAEAAAEAVATVVEAPVTAAKRGGSPKRKPAEAAQSPAPAKAKSKESPADAAPAEKPKAKVKLVRDSFTMPREDFALIDALKARSLQALRPVKKSELLRAGLQVLSRLDDAALEQALAALEPLKPGRPRKSA